MSPENTSIGIRRHRFLHVPILLWNLLQSNHQSPNSQHIKFDVHCGPCFSLAQSESFYQTLWWEERHVPFPDVEVWQDSSCFPFPVWARSYWYIVWSLCRSVLCVHHCFVNESFVTKCSCAESRCNCKSDLADWILFPHLLSVLQILFGFSPTMFVRLSFRTGCDWTLISWIWDFDPAALVAAAASVRSRGICWLLWISWRNPASCAWRAAWDSLPCVIDFFSCPLLRDDTSFQYPSSLSVHHLSPFDGLVRCTPQASAASVWRRASWEDVSTLAISFVRTCVIKGRWWGSAACVVGTQRQLFTPTDPLIVHHWTWVLPWATMRKKNKHQVRRFCGSEKNFKLVPGRCANVECCTLSVWIVGACSTVGKNQYQKKKTVNTSWPAWRTGSCGQEDAADGFGFGEVVPPSLPHSNLPNFLKNDKKKRTSRRREDGGGRGERGEGGQKKKPVTCLGRRRGEKPPPN